MAHIVVYNETGNRRIHVLTEVADMLCLVADQTVDEATLLRVIDLNTAAIRARVEARPTRNPQLRALLAQCLDATEAGLARVYAKSEGH